MNTERKLEDSWNLQNFFGVAFQEAHEGRGYVAWYLDDKLSEFLEKFESRGRLNDTAVFFVSDHGNNTIGL